MKTRILLLLVLSFLTSNIVLSQEKFTLDSLSKYVKTNYSVPDLPAFNALGTEPVHLLRPSTAKDFSITANEFYDGKNIIIPKTFAVEFSPVKLIKGNKLTLQDFQKSAAWYNTRISIGTFRDSLNTSRVAIGFRTTLIDKGDPKSEKNLQYVYRKLTAKNKLRESYHNYKKQNWINAHPNSTYNIEVSDQKFNNEFDSLYAINKDSLIVLCKNGNIDLVVDAYENNQKWNAERLDVACALIGTSADSIAKNLKFDSFQAWITYAYPLGENGQFLLGGNAGCRMLNNSTFWSVSVPARVYIGSNDLKGLAEVQYVYKQQFGTNNVVARLGCEYRLFTHFWLNFSAGMDKDFTSNTSHLVSDFKIVYGI
jgi:hypothetical protein